MSAHHKSNFGSCYHGPTDRKGFALTTAKEWQREGYDRDAALQRAAECRKWISMATRAVEDFRKEGL